MSNVLKNSQTKKSLLPTEGIACTTCPNSIWFQNPRAIKCYCKAMFLIVWESGMGLEHKDSILDCDGMSMIDQKPLEAEQISIQNLAQELQQAPQREQDYGLLSLTTNQPTASTGPSFIPIQE